MCSGTAGPVGSGGRDREESKSLLNLSLEQAEMRKTEIEKRHRALKKKGGHPIPESQTPWQEIQREIVDELSEGMVLKPAVKYQKIDRKKGVPRDNH